MNHGDTVMIFQYSANCALKHDLINTEASVQLCVVLS